MKKTTKIILGATAIGLGVFLWIRATRKEQYASDDFSITLKSYSGKYMNDPEVIRFQKEWQGMVDTALPRIERAYGKQRPPIHVDIELDDSFDSDTFFIPSLATSCPKIKYTPQQGNCAHYKIRVGAKPLAERYKNRTTIEQMLTHELTHVFMLFYEPKHDSLPKHIIEGLPIHVANQQDQIRSVQNSQKKRSDKNWDYNKGEIPLDDYSEIIDRFEHEFSFG